MAIQSARRAVGRAGRRAWAFLIDTVEWTSNGDRRRRKFAERSDIYDPTAGSGPGGEVNEDLEAERRGDRED
jgi:hypothetical protein